MESKTINKYLPTGVHIAKKYEIIEVLGEDDFEILYLVRDINRKGSFFVLKELFLETFSSRSTTRVSTLAEAEGVFNKRKKQIIKEIEAQKSNSNLDDIKVYGYEEDNNTIYTIMEFSHNASLEKYLQYAGKDGRTLESLSELMHQESNSSKISFLIKAFLGIFILGLIGYFSYQFFQKNITEENSVKFFNEEGKDFPKLQERVANKPSVVLEKIKPQVEKIIEPTIVKKVEENISKEVETIREVKIIEENITEENTTKVSDENISTIVLKEKPMPKKLSTKESIKVFLDTYIDTISKDSANKTLKYYVTSVKQYFKFKNPSHKTIAKSQARYNKKWKYRDFKMVNFKILKEYKKNNRDYIDLKTTTTWNIKNRQGKKLSGKSRGKMTLKRIEDGFKIVSIK